MPGIGADDSVNYECSASTNSSTAQTSHVRNSQNVPTTGSHRSTARPFGAAGVTTSWELGLHGTNECNVVQHEPHARVDFKERQTAEALNPNRSSCLVP